MKWETLTTERFDGWFLGLSDKEQIDILAMVNILEITGPNLGRPHADKIRGTNKVKNLKELIVQHAGKPYRVFYAFDPDRRAVLLCGGCKVGIKEKLFYRKMISTAETEFLKHLSDMTSP